MLIHNINILILIIIAITLKVKVNLINNYYNINNINEKLNQLLTMSLD